MQEIEMHAIYDGAGREKYFCLLRHVISKVLFARRYILSMLRYSSFRHYTLPCASLRSFALFLHGAASLPVYC